MPSLSAAMIGRGLVADPAMVTRLQGGPSLTGDVWKAFHDALYEGYCLWSYMIRLLPQGEKAWKQLRKAANPNQYEEAVQAIFRKDPVDCEK